MLRLINFSSLRLLSMKQRVSISFSIKYAKLLPLRVSERSVFSREGSLVTVCYLQECYRYVCSSSSVISRSNMKAELLDSPPPYSTAACYKVGWIQKDIFMQRFKHFVLVLKPSKKIPLSWLVTFLIP
jgi:hypothetical protein